MRTPRHHPAIRRAAGDGWVVMCRDCHRDKESSIPVGIELPVTSLYAAELIRDNHLRQTGRRDLQGSRSSQGAEPGALERPGTRPQTPPAVA